MSNTPDVALHEIGITEECQIPMAHPVEVLASYSNAQAATNQASQQGLRFTGSGSEYFRIWSVNLTLTVLTLGLYSAWAKVRRLQYFYQHTELDGAVFDYVASPVAILLGRLVALVLLVLYYLAFDFSAAAGAVVTALLALVLPYLLWQSSRFKARNTRYRGLSFGFEGSLADAYRVYLPPLAVLFAPAVVAAFLLGPKAQLWVGLFSILGLLALPFLHALFRQYIQTHLRYGVTRFGFTAKAKDFMVVWLTGLGVMLACGVFLAAVFFVVGAFVGGGVGRWSTGLILATTAATVGLCLPYFLIGSYFAARFQKLIWERTSVGEIGLRCDVSALRLLRLQCVNTLLVVLTLGLYRPFAAIRVVRYRLESMTVTGSDHLFGFQAGDYQSRRGATGESAAELFDLDVGL